jgi:hypothetical protein
MRSHLDQGLITKSLNQSGLMGPSIILLDHELSISIIICDKEFLRDRREWVRHDISPISGDNQAHESYEDSKR